MSRIEKFKNLTLDDVEEAGIEAIKQTSNSEAGLVLFVSMVIVLLIIVMLILSKL